MRMFPGSAEVQRTGCETVNSIARPVGYDFEHTICNGDQDELVSLGADTLIIGAMRRFPDDVDLLSACISALSGLAQWNAPTYGVMGEHGAVEAIASAIKHHPDDTTLLGTVGCLGSFTDFDDEGAHRNLERTAATNVTSAILQGMTQYIDDGGIVLQGLCYFSNACRPASMRAQMVDAGYIEGSVRMMQLHRHDTPGVRGEVIWVNDECFAADAGHRARLARAGFLPEVVDTLRSINGGGREDVMTNERTFNNACHLLVLFAGGSAEHRAALQEAGCAEVVRQGLALRRVGAASACPALRALGEESLPAACA